MARQGAEMATQTIPETTTAMMRRRFTVAEYQRIGDAGIFSEDDRVELIAGEIYSDESHWYSTGALCQPPHHYSQPPSRSGDCGGMDR